MAPDTKSKYLLIIFNLVLSRKEVDLPKNTGDPSFDAHELYSISLSGLKMTTLTLWLFSATVGQKLMFTSSKT